MNTVPNRLGKKTVVSLRQGYLSPEDSPIAIRIREAGKKHMLTIKKGSGVRRIEEELPLSSGKFEALWPLTAGARIAKTRTKVRMDSYNVEIDVYHHQHDPLITAEIEVDDIRALAKIDLPDWIGTEVTGLSEFTNAAMAYHGVPSDLPEIRAGKPRPITHAGALPYRRKDGAWEALLITSRSGKRWIAPKGVWELESDLDETAIIESWEEAGVIGEIDSSPLGLYADAGNRRDHWIEMFGLNVTEVKDTWPEAGFRERRWLPLDEAGSLVADAGLSRLVDKLASRLVSL